MSLKSWVFKNILSPKKMKLDIKNVQKYQVVSFDVFDTLLKRDVKLPTDIFDVMAKDIINKELAENFKALLEYKC